MSHRRRRSTGEPSAAAPRRGEAGQGRAGSRGRRSARPGKPQGNRRRPRHIRVPGGDQRPLPPPRAHARPPTAHQPRQRPRGGIETPSRLSDWLPLQGRPGISRRSGGRALPARRPAIGQGRRGTALPLASGRVRSGAGGGCHWLESRLVVRRWVASQAESRSGTGAACAGRRSGRAARCRGTATPAHAGQRRGAGARGARGEPLTGGGRPAGAGCVCEGGGGALTGGGLRGEGAPRPRLRRRRVPPPPRRVRGGR